ncbi:protein FAM162A [Perognathus longimembris pacificus]|uniref:protein FAM162A n=1 Tax=Perognathus longimembris pacificus TaxID=214514 RepID=UPI002018D7B6|nr:protein FAM162A [Perognathus longimembris pacificus]
MGSWRGLRLAAGNCFQLYEQNASSAIRFTRNSELKGIYGFCTKPQESPKATTNTYSHRVPLHKPTDWEKKILIWSGRFKKADEIPETISFEMLDAAKNKVRVKISYLMIALTVAGCVMMVIEGKKAVKRNESLTKLNLERKARLREEAAALKDKAE